MCRSLGTEDSEKNTSESNTFYIFVRLPHRLEIALTDVLTRTERCLYKVEHLILKIKQIPKYTTRR